MIVFDSVYEKKINERILNMATIGVIAGKREIATKFVDDLVGEIPLKYFDYIINTRYRYEWHFKNGAVYKVYVVLYSTAPEMLRGVRFEKVYVHEGTTNPKFMVEIPHILHCDIEYF